MTTTRETMADLVARVDLPALVEHYAGHAGRRRGDKWAFSCPHPQHADRAPSFSVWIDRSGGWRAKCHGCGFTGDALGLVKWLEGVDDARGAERLRTFTGTPADMPPVRPRAPRTAPPPVRPTPPARPAAGWQPMADTGAAARLMARYLRDRGWPPEVVDTFGLSVIVDRWREPRVRHTFHAYNGTEWVQCGWQDRALNPDAERRWDTPIGASLPPYNARSLDRDGVVGVIVTEGPADCITATVALGTHGERLAVIGVAGTDGFRREWFPLLEGLPVVIAADNDDAGTRLVNDIRGGYIGPRLTVLELTCKDLTDTARAHGYDAVCELLVAPFTLSPAPDDDTSRTRDTTPATSTTDMTHTTTPVPTPETPPATSAPPLPAAGDRPRLTSAHRPCRTCGRAMMAGQDRDGDSHYSCRTSTAAVCTCDPDRVAWLMDNVVPVLGDSVLPAPCAVHVDMIGGAA